MHPIFRNQLNTPTINIYKRVLLLIEQAQVAQSFDGSSAKAFLPGYDGTIHIQSLLWLVAKLMVSLYLTASALMKFDLATIALPETILRLGLAILILFKAPEISTTVFFLTVALLAFHQIKARLNMTRGD